MAASDARLPLESSRVAHAGEEGEPDNVWEAIRLLRVQRIDHGIRSLEDLALMAHLERAQVPLKLCPLSNLRLQVYAGALERHLRQLLSSCMLVTINSDDPGALPMRTHALRHCCRR